VKLLRRATSTLNPYNKDHAVQFLTEQDEQTYASNDEFERLECIAEAEYITQLRQQLAKERSDKRVANDIWVIKTVLLFMKDAISRSHVTQYLCYRLFFSCIKRRRRVREVIEYQSGVWSNRFSRTAYNK